MAAQRWEQTLSVGKMDRYEANVDADWLGAETIASAEVTSGDNAVVTAGSVDISGGTVGVLLTGASAGRTTIHFSWTTNTGRGSCDSAIITVVAC